MADTNTNGSAAHRPASFLAKKPPAQPAQPAEPRRRAPAGLTGAIQIGQRDPLTNKIEWLLPNSGRYPVEQVVSFQSLMTSAARVYRQYDEAIKHNLDNARFMRNDCGIMECLEARQRCTALLNWHLEPEDTKSPLQKQLCTELTNVLKRIRRFTEYRRVLLEAIWFGKYAIQHQYGWQNIGGQMRLMPTPRHVGDTGWSPIHGDKLCFRFDDGNLLTDEGQYDGQVGIRIGTSQASSRLLRDRFKIEFTDRGPAYFLDEDERRLVTIHKHMIEDGEYEDALSAGKIHGVGVRSRIYWEWVQKQETLGFLMEYLERCAGGIQLWKYPQGNPSAKKDAEAAASTYVGGSHNVVMVPVPAGDDMGQYGVEIIEPGMAGIDMLKDLIDNHFGHRIKRYILGQVLSSEAESTGLGSGVADAHMDTLDQIIKYDATNAEETITFETLQWLKEWNFPDARNVHVAFKIDTETDDAKEKMEAYGQAYEMGLDIKASEVAEMIGAALPGPDDKVLSKSQQQQQEAALGGMPGQPGQPGGIGSGGVHGIGSPGFGGEENDEASEDDFPDDPHGDGGGQSGPPAPAPDRGGDKEHYSAFSEADHPREPAGSPDGGQFVDRMRSAHEQHRKRVKQSVGFEIGRQMSEASKPNPGFKDALRTYFNSPKLADDIEDAEYQYPSGHAVKSFVHEALKEHWGYGDFDRKIKPAKIPDNPRFDQLMKEHKVGWQRQVAIETQREANRELARLGIPKDFGIGVGLEVAKAAAIDGADDINDLLETKLQEIVDEWNEQLDDDAEPVRYARTKKLAKGQKSLNEHWVTIGAEPGEDGERHGGTHVKIDGGGNIVAGPKALADKGIKKLDDFGEKEKSANGPTNVGPTGENGKKAPENGATNVGPSLDVHSAVRSMLASGKHMSLREIQAEIGQGRHDPQNPTAHPVNAALVALRDAGEISVHEPRFGEPSFWMTDEQIANSRKTPEKSGELQETQGNPRETPEEEPPHAEAPPQTAPAEETNPEPAAAPVADAEAAGDSGGDPGDAGAVEDEDLDEYKGPDSVANGSRKAGFSDNPDEVAEAKSLGLHVQPVRQWHVYGKDAESVKELAAHLQEHGYGKTLDQKAKLSELAGYSPAQIEEFKRQQREKEQPAQLFDTATEAGQPPREAAKAAQKAIDADYEFARQSSVPNAGEDLKNSARHKVNAWRGLQDAEADGTAEAMVTRDNLLKAEPHNLMSHVDKNPLTALAMHNALKAFPAKPGYGNDRRLARRSDDEVKRDRSHYLDTYREVKAKAEELAANETNPMKAMEELKYFISKKIQSLREGRIPVGDTERTMPDNYNNTANSLIDLSKKLSDSYYESKKSTNLHNRLKEFADKLGEKYPGLDPKDLASHAIEHAKDLMEGRSLPATFGESKAGEKRPKEFDPSAEYVTHATRKGGKDLGASVATPQKATKFMTDTLGMRGVQWGNSVTDDERQHHAKMSAEAFADLADVTGLPPEMMSLGGKLGLAIGARGHGTAMAHYEPGSVVINLTRKNGVGSLAHEWGHGFDHMLGDFKIGSTGGAYQSEDARPSFIKRTNSGGVELGPDGKPIVVDKTADPVWSAMDGVRKAFASSGFNKRISQYISDKLKNKEISDKKAEYWKSTREMFARSFEQHVQHKLGEAGRENTYLAGLNGNGPGGDPHPYWPTKAESAAMASAFDSLFEAYKQSKGIGPQKYSRAEMVRYFRREIDRQSAPNRFDAVFSALTKG